MPSTCIARSAPSLSLPIALCFATLATTTSGFCQSAPPSLLTAVAPAPPAASAWAAAEQARNAMITDVDFVRVDTSALRGILLTGALPLMTFSVDLFGDVVVADIDRSDWVLGHQVFRGSVRGHTGSWHLTMGDDDTVSGLIQFDDRSFALAWSTHQDVHVLERIDPSQLPAHMRCGIDHSHEITTAAAGMPDGPNLDCGKTTIDILVFYTPRARQNAGGQIAMQNTIIGAIAQANDGHDASGSMVEFRLVHMAETNYVEDGTNTDLSRFRSTSDGFMDEVHALRQAYGGDLMHLITDPVTASYCGIGYLMTNLSTNFRTSAFGVTVRGCIPNQSFTHECGHNLGCHHDPANAGNALYPYSYGYRTPDNAYRTIMSYAPGSRINRWSSPTVQYLGYTMGNATQDNKQSLLDARATASQFYATTAPRWCDLGGGIPGLLGLPVVVGSGTVNGAEPLTASVRQYRPNAFGALIIGTSQVNVPIFGGTLVPSLDLAVTITGNGSPIDYDANWLASAPSGAQVWFQAAFLDANAVQGFAASNAVRVARP